MGSYVGIDLHRQRSVVVVLNDDGDRVSWSRIDNTQPIWLPRFTLPGLAPRWRWKLAGAGIGLLT